MSLTEISRFISLILRHKPETIGIILDEHGEKYTQSIEAQGLLPKSRLYVHLSKDEDTAHKVGARHGKSVIYRILSGTMHRNGFKFYCSVNGVWLTKAVPTIYLQNYSH